MRILGGEFRGRVLPTMDGKGCRPAMAKVRLALFSMLEARGVNLAGSKVLDVFAGTGALGFEAFSRGAQLVMFMEKNKALGRRIQENCRLLGLAQESCPVLFGDAVGLLTRPPREPFDLVFVDPPYGQNLLGPALEMLCSRFWLAEEAVVGAELEKNLELTTWPGDLVLDTDRSYGQTRICIWHRQKSV